MLRKQLLLLNTELQVQGLSVKQVQAVTGHKSDSMTERYSHLDARLISSVTEAQSVITGGEKPDRGNSKRRTNLQLVTMTESETTPKRKRA